MALARPVSTLGTRLPTSVADRHGAVLRKSAFGLTTAMTPSSSVSTRSVACGSDVCDATAPLAHSAKRDATGDTARWTLAAVVATGSLTLVD